MVESPLSRSFVCSSALVLYTYTFKFPSGHMVPREISKLLFLFFSPNGLCISYHSFKEEETVLFLLFYFLSKDARPLK